MAKHNQTICLSLIDCLSLFDHFVGLVLKGFKKTTHEWFVLKSLFCVIHFLMLKNWAYTHNFKDSVELISQFGGNELCNHLLFGPKNTQYMSPKYISKFTERINDHTEKPLLASLRLSYFTFFNEEMQDITSVEQITTYGSF